MTSHEMECILKSILAPEVPELDPPSIADWKKLSSKFNYSFEECFRHFIELMAKYQFPGDIYNVSTGRTNGNDLIAVVYDMEMDTHQWKEEMIPFYGIGNEGSYLYTHQS